MTIHIEANIGAKGQRRRDVLLDGEPIGSGPQEPAERFLHTQGSLTCWSCAKATTTPTRARIAPTAREPHELGPTIADGVRPLPFLSPREQGVEFALAHLIICKIHGPLVP